MGDTRYVLEPNIKDGKGGLRDLQTLIWIAKYLYRRAESITDLKWRKVHLDRVPTCPPASLKRRRFLWAVRCHLHYLAGRP